MRLRREFVQDPHTLYRRLRTQGPVHQVELHHGLRVWLITRYDDARALLNDPRVSKDNAGARRLFPPGTAGANGTSLSANMLHVDPPDHTRLRKLVAKPFTTRAIARLRPDIEQIVDDLTAALPTEGTVDLIESFALPLPTRVICTLLGVPPGDEDRFADWTRPFVTQSNARELRDAEHATREYLQQLIADKRAHPREDMLTELVSATDAGDRLTNSELLSMAFLLIIAGYETTVNLIGNGMLALLHHPPQMRLLRDNPDLLPSAVEEFLRYECPLHTATNRFTLEPVRVGDVEIPAGEFLLISLLAANRDPNMYPDPDTLDITRDNSTHLAFGHGIHRCLGAPLARLEAEIAFSKLLNRFPTITLAGDVSYRDSILMRGLNTLPTMLTIT
ncbi:MAG: cytochrome P450 [Mycobacterium sp.]|nr:cytochrome P450 [Mycobacterium sp.]